jgi:hypothetical protein
MQRAIDEAMRALSKKYQGTDVKVKTDKQYGGFTATAFAPE